MNVRLTFLECQVSQDERLLALHCRVDETSSAVINPLLHRENDEKNCLSSVMENGNIQHVGVGPGSLSWPDRVSERAI